MPHFITNSGEQIDITREQVLEGMRNLTKWRKKMMNYHGPEKYGLLKTTGNAIHRNGCFHLPLTRRCSSGIACQPPCSLVQAPPVQAGVQAFSRSVSWPSNVIIMVQISTGVSR
jgi:hypothetical protein